jgi:prephenate dehydrogenase
MSRIAKSSPAMWSDIFKQNKTNLLESIRLFEKELGRSRQMIEEENWEELSTWMKEATTLHKIL